MDKFNRQSSLFWGVILGPKETQNISHEVLTSPKKSTRGLLTVFNELEGKQDHLERSIWVREMGITTLNSMLCSWCLTSMTKTWSTLGIFFMFRSKAWKRENWAHTRCSFSVNLVLEDRKSDKPIPENTLLNSEEKRVCLFLIIPHGPKKR